MTVPDVLYHPGGLLVRGSRVFKLFCSSIMFRILWINQIILITELISFVKSCYYDILVLDKSK